MRSPLTGEFWHGISEMIGWGWQSERDASDERDKKAIAKANAEDDDEDEEDDEEDGLLTPRKLFAKYLDNVLSIDN